MLLPIGQVPAKIKSQCELLVGPHLLDPLVVVELRHHLNDLLEQLDVEAPK
jgi:hypothetical protein